LTVIPGVFEGCLKTDDGELWYVPRAGELGLPSLPLGVKPAATYDTQRFVPCADAEAYKVGEQNCDFNECEHSVYSPCTVEQTAAAIWDAECIDPYKQFNGLTTFIGYDSRGCSKPTCERDEECNSDERCVKDAAITPDCSITVDGLCRCGGGGWSIFFDPSLCVNVDLAGPRGAWDSLRIDDAEVGWYWTITPDGTLTTNSGDGVHEVTLRPQDQAEIDDLANSAYLRAGVTQGFACDFFGYYISGSVTLVIEGTEYTQDVTDCLEELPVPAWVLRL
jgi:hypothetical protein